MAKIKSTDGNLALEQKKYRVITIGATEKPKDIKLRVAAYARVSSASDDQLNSFAAQNKYYTSLISGKENWTMVDIYADEGITGTSIKKREDFKRMLSDCRKGKIDRILVKSISRFARNTKECLETIRELKTLGVSVYFEKENIDTAIVSGEMMTALFASFAQAESESISGNMRWSYQRRMRNGTFITCKAPFGYVLDRGNLKINETEAEAVRMIFKMYLDGHSVDEICTEMTQKGFQTRDRNGIWNHRSIAYILKNEKYIGDSLLQKRFTTDTLPYVKKKNNGEKERYYVERSHPPIIDRDIFETANKLLEKRNAHFHNKKGEEKRFSGIIICGKCQKYFKEKKNLGISYWTCISHDRNREMCSIKQISEWNIIDSFCRLYFKLKSNEGELFRTILTNLQTIRSRRMLWSLDVIELNKRISELTSQNQLLAALKQQGLVDPDIFISQTNALTEQLRSAKQEKERLLDTEQDEAIASTKELMEILEGGPDFLADFDEELFGELVDKIIVESNDRLRFRLKNGLELAETIERTVR